MPTCERRFFLNKLLNENQKRQEATEEQISKMSSSNSKGSRTTKMGGEQLKAKMKSGEIAN
tara:strand:+ start:813 stop:995 length:183 start_codon:yes stop_codon:yes gene_type:complete